MDHWTDFFPIVFLPFKLIVLGVGMYFAIKWHYDKEREIKEKEAKENETKDHKNPPI